MTKIGVAKKNLAQSIMDRTVEPSMNEVFITDKKLTLLLFLAILFFSISCSDSNEISEKCPVTVDSVSIIDTVKLEENVFYLVRRVYGWHDKIEVLELYDTKPTFDFCSKSNIEPVYADSLETTELVSHVYLDVKAKKLNIIYEQGATEKSYNSSLKLEIK